jgi:hypothetical protein
MRRCSVRRVAARWEDDGRGRGVADAAQLLPGVHELEDAFGAAEWVAEEPDVHLLPHLRDWCDADASLTLSSTDIDERGAYVVELTWNGERGDLGGARAAAFALIGQIAESATYVRQSRPAARDGCAGADGPVRFEVGTGMLATDTPFAPHGHVIYFDVYGAL